MTEVLRLPTEPWVPAWIPAAMRLAKVGSIDLEPPLMLPAGTWAVHELDRVAFYAPDPATSMPGRLITFVAL